MNWEITVGLETHVELCTREKLLCTCSAAFGGAVNTHCCPICLGQSGHRPVLNLQAAELAARAALALGCTVAERSSFDRKHYRSPDLPKGYQVTQFYHPLAREGALTLHGKTIGIRQIHLEEDAGRLLRTRAGTTVDFNRCGVPLIEIVTHPDFSTGAEAVAYLEALRAILRYLEVSDCRMEEGSLRCDVNLSVRPVGCATSGGRTELKNLGSLQAVARAIPWEAARQIALLEQGGTVAQETLRWDEDLAVATPMRAKENAADYRYCPEEALPPLVLSPRWLDAQRRSLPELPAPRRARLVRNFGLSDEDVGLITSHRALADFFEDTVAQGAPPKSCANWVMGPVLRRLHADGLTPEALPLSPAALARLIWLVEGGRLSRTAAVAVLDAVFSTGEAVDRCVTRLGLGLVEDEGLLHGTAAAVLSAHPGPAADFRAGKRQALGFLMGQAMHRLGGRAQPTAVKDALLDALEGHF